eukprot:symbB.v1.2.009055.t1/scaffold569.1/size186053/24
MAPQVSSESRCQEFQEKGFLHLKGFISMDECEIMKKRMKELVDGWDPEHETPAAFTTDSKQQTEMQGKSDYFLDSADRIHFFIEKSAADKDGKLKAGQTKFESLNKVGHGLHVLDPIAELVEELGWKDPVLPQSMYIFKQPLVGGEVTSHQDSSFLYTTPRPTCLGLWLALDKATTENGCLWARPGSHKEPVRRIFVRNPEHFDNGNKDATQLVFEALDEGKDPAWQWEGKMPEGHEPPSGGLGVRHIEILSCCHVPRQRIDRERIQPVGVRGWRPCGNPRPGGPFVFSQYQQQAKGNLSVALGGGACSRNHMEPKELAAVSWRQDLSFPQQEAQGPAGESERHKQA